MDQENPQCNCGRVGVFDGGKPQMHHLRVARTRGVCKVRDDEEDEYVAMRELAAPLLE